MSDVISLTGGGALFFTACRFNADIYVVSNEFLRRESTTPSKKKKMAGQISEVQHVFN